jgi:hypothetical protein
MKDELITSLCEAVMMDIMARSREYRKDKWVWRQDSYMNWGLNLWAKIHLTWEKLSAGICITLGLHPKIGNRWPERYNVPIRH